MIEKERLRFMYSKMVEIRLFEEAAIRTYKQRLWKGSLHACIGQEAVAAAAAAATEPSDYFVSTHRGHGHILAKGVRPDIFMAELFGRLEGQCRGRGGSMHMMDSERRVYPNGLVGSGSYIAAGIGFRINYLNTDEIVVCFSGDGAVNTGGFHEGLNMAAVWKAPVVHICENNGIGVSTRIKSVFPLANVSQRALAYGANGVTVDGTDCLALYETIRKAVADARKNRTITLIEAVCHRAGGHTAWDPSQYRSPDENDRWRYYDPIKRLREFLLGQRLFAEAEIAGWEADVAAAIEKAVEFAKSGKIPDLTREEALRYVYA